jgi:hypothetical protein
MTRDGLTLFSTPKGFRGHFKTIQINAIRSWALLQPEPEIILLGNDEGTAEIAREIGARHIPEVDRNEHGTPLVNSIFAKAEAAARHPLMCYVNADIILLSDFMETIQRICRMLPNEPFLIVGRKIASVDIPEILDFDAPDWESKLRRRAAAEGSYGTSDSDYFVFRKGLYPRMLPFTIGRFYWSPWLVYDAMIRSIKVIDATATITAVEPRHDYSHVSSEARRASDAFLGNVEVSTNRKLFKGCKYWTTANSSHVLTKSGQLMPSPLKRRVLGYFIALDFTLGRAFHVNPALRRYLSLARLVYRPMRPLVAGLERLALNRGLRSR